MYMELPEHLPLADLKKAIKEFKTTQTPKLSSKKSVLMEYAARVGIVKARETASASASQEDEEERVPVKVGKRVPLEAVVAPLAPRETRIEPKKKALPEVLKGPVKPDPLGKKPVEAKPAKGGLKAPPEPEKPKGSPFAVFMAEHKGQGLSMGQLAELYRRRK